MSESQASEYGGSSGIAYDACYHKVCDTLSNVNQQALQEMANAALQVTLDLSGSQQRRPASFQTPIQLDHKGNGSYDESSGILDMHQNCCVALLFTE